MTTETQAYRQVESHVCRLCQMLVVFMIPSASGGQQGVCTGEIDIGIHVITTHEANVLDVVAHSVVSHGQPKLEPACRTPVEGEASLSVRSYLRTVAQHHAIECEAK